MTATYAYPFPAELVDLPRDRPAVIEASAGTGKTYLIEHLVVDRLVRGEARIDQMLVVTFSERASAELVRRIRALVRRVLRPDPANDAAADSPHVWTIDAGARERLEAAAGGLDVAPISTIHAFCQRVLTEHAFASGRLLAQNAVESRTAFAAAFDEVIRGRLDGELQALLAAWLVASGDVRGMEDLLYKARGVRCDWSVTYDPARLADAARRFAALNLPELHAITDRAIKRAKYVVQRIDELHAICTRFVAHGEPAWLLADVDARVRSKDIFGFILDGERLGGARAKPGVAALLAHIEALCDAALPLATAVAQRFGPLIEERLRARKRAAGLYDFDDMLVLVAEALRGPRGAELVAALRGRYRLAVIDEFQDTDPVQWEIFRAIFLGGGDGDARPLYLVGDPKQSIYGFRGADVSTYEGARAAVTAEGGAHHLERNFRSTPAIIDTYNAIFDQTARHPFFSTGMRYDHPVSYGGQESETVDRMRPLTLLRVQAGQAEAEETLPMRIVRSRLARAIADEIAGLIDRADVTDASEIFVLTRTRRESQTVADALATRGIPAVLAAQEGLYETEEARQVRDLLRAIADPHDPAKRLRAWLTPFFGLSVADLPAAAAGGDQALIDRLLGWHAAAERGDLAGLFGRILDDSGLARRELFAGDALRRLTNFRQLFELLALDAARARRPLGEIARRLGGLVARLAVPQPEEGNTQRAEGDRDAVQIMTMHRAKGLEADVVFVYGGFNLAGRDDVRSYVVDGRRVRIAGRPRLPGTLDLIKRERDGEDQRLYYVALTRARKRLYLPYSGNVPEGDVSPFDSPPAEDTWKLTGGYRHVNRRLHELMNEPDPRRLRDPHQIVIDARATDGDGPVGSNAALPAWRPSAEDIAPIEPDRDLAVLRRARAGAVTTSYSRIKQAHGGYRPSIEVLDEVAAPAGAPAGDGELRGGAATGIFLHALLEVLPLSTLLEAPELDAWSAREDVRAVAEPLLRRHGRDPGELRPALRLAHAALTATLPIVGGALAGLAHAAHTAREMEFLFPFPLEAGGADRGYVKGFVDVIFEHEGRSYFGDWKTDRLPVWDAATIAAHVEANYALQERLYSLALVRMLGITDAASYEARFGGTLYIFVRGLGGSPDAVRSRRPSYDEITRWQHELAAALEPGEAA
ncbi:MAG TPA: UvrD-helicase domain-containing protein [Polyangia bacterium]|nr:UvrD-helicase domain-containing protein [Polyangia bacterium]